MSFQGRALQQAWHLVNAENQTVGRLASQIASMLRGKHKPTFMPNKDMGDHIVIVNAEKVNFTGKKWKLKIYKWHTGYPGGLKQRTATEMLEKNPRKILKKAILGMLQRNKLRKKFMEKRLWIYTGPDHPHKDVLPDSVPPLPKVPEQLNGTFHFGLDHYAHPDTFQYSPKMPKRRGFRHYR